MMQPFLEAVRRIAPFGIVLLQRDGAFLFVKSDPDCHAKRPYVKDDLTPDDIDDLMVAMRAKAERNKKKKSGV